MGQKASKPTPTPKVTSKNVATSISNIVNKNSTQLMNSAQADAKTANKISLQAGDKGITFGVIKQTSKSYVNLDSFSKQFNSVANQNAIQTQAKQAATAISEGTASSDSTNIQTDYMNVFNSTTNKISTSCFTKAANSNVINVKAAGGITVGYIDQDAESKAIANCVNKQITNDTSVNDLQDKIDQQVQAKSQDDNGKIIMMVVILLLGLLFGLYEIGII